MKYREAGGRRRVPIAIAVAVALLLGGCSSGRPDRRTTAPTASVPTPTPSTPVATSSTVETPERCSALPGARALWLPITGGRLEANVAGTGPDAVVFLHEIGQAGMCGFDTFAAWLIRTRPGVQVVLVNRCGYGTTVCPAATGSDIAVQTRPAVDWARAHGATRVTLVGASGGGMDAVGAGASVRGVDAVVNISGAVNDTGADNRAVARTLTVPTLFAVAPDDPDCPVASIRLLFDLVPARTKRFVLLSANSGLHGWALLLDTDGRPLSLANRVADWAVGRTA